MIVFSCLMHVQARCTVLYLYTGQTVNGKKSCLRMYSVWRERQGRNDPSAEYTQNAILKGCMHAPVVEPTCSIPMINLSRKRGGRVFPVRCPLVMSHYIRTRLTECCARRCSAAGARHTWGMFLTMDLYPMGCAIASIHCPCPLLPAKRNHLIPSDSF